MNVYNSFIHISPKLEMTPVLFGIVIVKLCDMYIMD